MHCVWPFLDDSISNWRIEVDHNQCQELRVFLIISFLADVDLKLADTRKKRRLNNVKYETEYSLSYRLQGDLSF